MSGPFGSSQWMYQSAAGFYDYEIGQSLRFEDGDSPQLNRTPSSAGNRKTYTISLWVKRSNFGLRGLFAAKQTKDDTTACFFNTNDEFVFVDRPSNVKNIEFRTNAKFRDTSAWYHFVIKVDTTQSTSSNRVKIYVNGEQITSWAVSTYPSQNYNTAYWNNTQVHRIGSFQDNSILYHDGYIAEFNFVDGTALEPTSFGETKSGIWIPKAYSGSYGTNGFYLDFADGSALGDDESGNTNDFTSSGLAASDQVIDSPTNNFSTLNGQMRGNGTFSQGNLRVVGIGGNYDNFTNTVMFDINDGNGWYWEWRSSGNDGATEIGVCTTDNPYLNQSDPTNPAAATTGGVSYQGNGNKKVAGTTSSYGSTWTSGDIIGVAVKDGKVWFAKNGTWQNSGDPASGTNAAATGLSGDYVSVFSINGTNSGNVNFGQDSTFAGQLTAQGNSDANGQGDFYYEPPSSFLALCSANLPSPAIDPNEDERPQDYFNTVLDTGTGSAKSVTGVGFKPDWVWRKARSNAQNHTMYDVVRGVHKILQSNTSNAEDTNANSLTSFDSDGFSLGTAYPNDNNYTYASWCWLAGNGTSSNTDGNRTSTVSANTKAGFSIMTYSEVSGSNSVGHGLDEKPELIIIKRRDSAEGWITWHEQFAPPTNKALYLNETYAQGASGSNWMTAVTDSTFTYTSGQYTSAGTKVAYCFHSVDGYSKIGSYTGNGSSDGTFVFTGFRPAFILMKRYDGTENWLIYDNKRDPFNVTDEALLPNTSSASGGSANAMDMLSNGFKFRSSAGSLNASGGDYIYMAFAEQPFKYANAR